MRQLATAIALAFLGLTTPSCAAPATSSGTDVSAQGAEQAMEAYREAGILNGAVLIARGEDVLYTAGHGVGGPGGGPLSSETRFRIASLTKQFTAATILKLMEDGKLRLDDPITKHLPYYEPEAGNRIMIGQLLTHTAGLSRTAGRRDDRRVDRVTDVEPSIRLIMEDPLARQPGTGYEYSNAGYWILGAVIEAVTGQSYPDAVSEILVEPLGLEATSLPRSGDPVTSLATGMRAAPFSLEPEPFLGEHGAPWAAGMVVSTVADLHRWNLALHSGEVFDDPDTYAIMTAPAEAFRESDVFGQVAAASGLFIAELPNGREMIFHDGHVDGFTSELRYYPEEQVTTVVLDNGSGDVTATGNALTAIAFGEPVPEPQPASWRQVVDAIGDDDEADIPSAFDELTETEINWLGYAYIAEKRPVVAVRLFERGAERFSNSANMHDSLGEALWHAGRKADAIGAYQQALEIDPDFANAKGMIQKIEAGDDPG
jgi:CubicO group peptidase (beta-lactamase class C family)